MIQITVVLIKSSSHRLDYLGGNIAIRIELCLQRLIADTEGALYRFAVTLSNKGASGPKRLKYPPIVDQRH